MNVVDVAGVALVEGDPAERDPPRDRQVDHALELAADPAMGDLLSSPSTRPAVTPSSGLLVMIRIVPASLEAP